MIAESARAPAEDHPLAGLFPLLEGQALQDLIDDIRIHGLREPIILLDEQILDGRNRHRACLAAGVEPEFEGFEGDDPMSYVISRNLHRRHLSESQRAMVAARLANLDEGRPSNTAPIGAVSQERAGELLNVGRRSVQRAADVQTRAVPEVIAKVDAGHIPVSTAARVAKLPASTQTAIVRQVEVQNLSPSAMRRAVREAVREAYPVPDLPSPAEAVKKAKQLSEEHGKPAMVIASDGQYHGYVSPEDDAEEKACEASYTGLRAFWEADPSLATRLASFILRKRPYQRANVERAITFMQKFQEAWYGQEDEKSAA